MAINFAILSLLTLAGAIAAMSLRNLIHCALALTVAFAGLAGFYLQLNAQFVGFAQILVYIGAVAILIVFAILLTRSGEPNLPRETDAGTSSTPGEIEKTAASGSGPEGPFARKVCSRAALAGLAVAIVVFSLLLVTILTSSVAPRVPTKTAAVPVRELGGHLMMKYLLPLEVIGLLLTAALIGAVIIAMQEKTSSDSKS